MDKLLGDIFKILENNPSNSVTSHYGISHEQSLKLEADMIRDLIINKQKSDIIDKYFPALSAEDRGKVIIFAIAIKNYHKMQDHV